MDIFDGIGEKVASWRPGLGGKFVPKIRSTDALPPPGRRLAQSAGRRRYAACRFDIGRLWDAATCQRLSVARGDAGERCDEHTLFVATTRQRDPSPGTLFNGERSPALSYAELTVSIPPTHVPGAVEFAKAAPGDPNTDFVARSAEILDGDKAFLQALNVQLALRPRGKRDIFLFVHGFNTLFAEAAYTHAQVVHDIQARFRCPWCSLGPRAATLSNMSTTTTARPSRETTSYTR